MELMRSQKNQLLEIIKIMELDPFNFEWSKESNRKEIVSFLKYKDTDYRFGIKIYPQAFEWFASPGFEYSIEKHEVYSWNNVVVGFQQWLSCLSREISQTDLWEELEKIKLFENVEFETENNIQQFTYQEVKQIETGIGEIRRYLLNVVNNDKEDSKIINEKLDYLIESSERMSKKDWANIFYGGMVSLSVSLALNPEQGQVMFQLFKNAVSGIIKLISAHGI